LPFGAWETASPLEEAWDELSFASEPEELDDEEEFEEEEEEPVDLESDGGVFDDV
jgi:hypothetical protein